MSKNILIKNATIVNDGSVFESDILIKDQRIERISKDISDHKALIIQAENLHVLPGVIDDQVHFREPGLTHKANIYTESRAAVAGGVTSFMEMPNTIPNVLTLDLLEEKYALGAAHSLANYSFFMGINQGNLEEALRINNENVCGITDDGLYFHNNEGILANYPDFLEKLFSRSNSLVALHSEDDQIIRRNEKIYQSVKESDFPSNIHELIRSKEACTSATRRVVDIARKHGNRLHFFHISTEDECLMFDTGVGIRDKRITAEACVHHLTFSSKDYSTLGSFIKWNPSVKSEADRLGLWQALRDGSIDFIATDHAPHLLEEKNGGYLKAHSGGPLVQHSLVAILEEYHKGNIDLTFVAEKMAHNVAEAYRMKDRGFIREGYFADLVLVDLNAPWRASKSSNLYKCGWSPFDGVTFKSKVLKTIVNGHVVYDQGSFKEDVKGMRLLFERDR